MEVEGYWTGGSYATSTQGSNSTKKLELTANPTTKPLRYRGYYYDTESGAWYLYYTGNGKSFDLIANQCGSIFVDGMEVTNE
jgi:hypothetical protein